MKEKELIIKCLPNFYSDFCSTVHRIMPFEDAYIFVDRITKLLVDELQNFTDNICKEQRENCYRGGMIGYDTAGVVRIPKIIIESILNAEQPKI